uniref:hypothetical protein n=1 Tax=Stenotrophomonas sp. GbtcB23 TaxID=2824768 RepID=UPI001C301820
MRDADGVTVATLDDCRYRRTSLRRHHTLASVAFHYETVPTALLAAREGVPLDVSTTFGAAQARTSDNAT